MPLRCAPTLTLAAASAHLMPTKPVTATEPDSRLPQVGGRVDLMWVNGENFAATGAELPRTAQTSCGDQARSTGRAACEIVRGQGTC